MPQFRRHIQGNMEHFRQRHNSALDTGVRLTRENIERFIDACETRGQVEGMLERWREQLKGNPRCLKRLYQSTRSGIEENIALLVEQAHARLLEQEQLEIGWSE